MLLYNLSGKISISRAQSFVQGLSEHVTEYRVLQLPFFLLFLYFNLLYFNLCYSYILTVSFTQPANIAFQTHLSPSTFHSVCPLSAFQSCINRAIHFFIVKCHTYLFFNCQCGYKFVGFFHLPFLMHLYRNQYSLSLILIET